MPLNLPGQAEVEVNMIKKAIFLILLLIPLWLTAQDMPFAVKSKTKYSASGMVGYTKIDSVKYYQLRFVQEFNVWKIGMGFDLDFLLDKNHRLEKRNWDHFGDWINKIYYMKYAQKGDPFYLHVGGFPGLTLGNGLIMQNYSNMIFYPELRNTGLMIGSNPKLPAKPSFEVFTSNIEKFQIMSLSARFKPIPDSTIRILDDIRVGFTLVTDRNQYGNIKYVADDSLSYLTKHLKSKPATVYGFGYTLPILQIEEATIGNYAEMASIVDYGTGFILPGIYADMNFLKVNLEYRIYGDKFTPAFFDRNYEEERASVVGDTIVSIVTKEEILKTLKASQGWYGSVQTLLWDRVKASFAWQNTFGKELDTGKSIWFKLWVDTQYKRLENVYISYSKTNTGSMAITKPNQPNAEIQSAVTIRASKKRLFLIGQYAERYKDKNGDGKVNLVKETKRSVGIGVKYTF